MQWERRLNPDDAADAEIVVQTYGITLGHFSPQTILDGTKRMIEKSSMASSSIAPTPGDLRKICADIAEEKRFKAAAVSQDAATKRIAERDYQPPENVAARVLALRFDQRQALKGFMKTMPIDEALGRAEGVE